jgi:adenine-specific DNA methylase
MGRAYLDGRPPADRPVSSPNVKSRGAYYTDRAVADFLVRWAVRAPADRVLDPSFGGGVFLTAAAERVEALGGAPGGQVWGVELDPDEHGRVADALRQRWPFNGSLVRSDFFDVGAERVGRFEAVVGNPPFIRYQRFKGEARGKALARTLAEGVRLPKLASSWAPFVVHAASLVRPGGRMALVVPAEIGHADYAVPVLRYLRRSFGSLALVAFREKLFPDLSEDTVLLLADDAGGSCETLGLLDLESANRLDGLDVDRRSLTPVDVEAVARREARLVEFLLSDEVRQAYAALRSDRRTWALSDLARVGIGYVTGANRFFHVSAAEAERYRLPAAVLRPAVLRGRSLDGIAYRADDWRRARDGGEPVYLLDLAATPDVPDGVRAYLAEGEAEGVPNAYKCRVRTPWYAVPNVHTPEAFLTYMSGWGPQLVANEVGATAPNSLHVVRLHPRAPVDGRALAVLWQTSISRLSAEVEGRALGGGMLKLEPREAGRVRLPRCADVPSDLFERLDALVRDGRRDEAQAEADEAILIGALGMGRATVQALHDGADALRQRRTKR